MPKSALLLDPCQRQVLNDLSVDAWYLTPLSRAQMDTDYQTSQQEIADIIGQLTPLVSTQTDNNAVEKAEIKPPDITPALDKETVSAPQKIRLSAKSFEPIRIDADIDLSPPSEPLIVFPEYDQPVISPTLSAIHAATVALQENDVGVENSQTLSGQGSEKPDWLFIMPPPTLSHLQTQQLFSDSEKQLFDELLAVIGQTWGNIYVTPLLKQSVYKQKDPNPTLLAQHLPVLQAEITARQPKHIFLMGRVANHAILSTKAPLSKLMPETYELQLGEQRYPLTVLPSLHYFLAIPAEKQLLWQRMKAFA